MPPSKPAGDHPEPLSEERGRPSQLTSMLFGLGIVAMAAGYVLLGFRFRNIGVGGVSGGAEYRASQQAAETFSGEGRAKAQEQARARAKERLQEESQRAGARPLGSSQDSPNLRWATDALQLKGLQGLTAQEAKAAYHRRAKQCHPDTGGVTADLEKFKELGKAYEALARHFEAAGRAGTGS